MQEKTAAMKKSTKPSRYMWYALIGSAFLLLMGSTGFLLVRTSVRAFSSTALQVNGATTATSLDPSTLTQTQTNDTRPCSTTPSSSRCDGLYPVTPPSVSPTIGSQNGAGTCIDNTSRIVESQNLLGDNNVIVGVLQLRYMPICGSYYGYLSFTYPLSQVTRVSIYVQTEQYGWFEQVSLLPPLPTHIEQSGPVSGKELTTQELYSPLIFNPTTPVSAHIDLELTGNISIANYTSSYSGGVKQYTA